VATSDLFAEVFRDTARRTVTLTTVTLVVVVTFHPTAFAGCVFGQFLALEANSIDVGVAFRCGFASTGTNESAGLVLVASEKRLASLHCIDSFLARALGGFEFWGVSGRAQFHHRLALPSGLSGASVGLIVSAVNEGGGISGQDSVGHHCACLLLRINFIGKSRAQNSKNNQELHVGYVGLYET